MSEPAPRLAPRSAVAVADFELLRVARTSIAEPERAASLSIGDRIRGLALFRAVRPSTADSVPVRLGHRED